MTRKNNKYHCKLDRAFYRSLVSKFHAGVSKRELKKTDPEQERKTIHTSGTLETYAQRLKMFAAWLETEHPEVHTVKKAKKYANDWLEFRATEAKNQKGQSLSAATVNTDAAAINKVYGIRPDDPDRFAPPVRHRADITRSRGPAVRDAHFSVRNNQALVDFGRGTGCRAGILHKLRGGDLYTYEDMQAKASMLREKARQGLTADEQMDYKALQEAIATWISYPQYDYFVLHWKDKGKRTRYAPIIGPHKADIVQRMRNTPAGEKVWLAIPSAMDEHAYRSDYATAFYKQLARPISEIPYDKVDKAGRPRRSDVYSCRNDLKGVQYDRRAMRFVSKALGHDRVGVIASNYLRGI